MSTTTETRLADVVAAARKQLQSSAAMRLRADLREEDALRADCITCGIMSMVGTLLLRGKEPDTDPAKNEETMVEQGREVAERMFILGWTARELREFNGLLKEGT